MGWFAPEKRDPHESALGVPDPNAADWWKRLTADELLREMETRGGERALVAQSELVVRTIGALEHFADESAESGRRIEWWTEWLIALTVTLVVLTIVLVGLTIAWWASTA
jgi:hypothetical protein